MAAGYVYATDMELEAEKYSVQVFDCEPAGLLVVAKGSSGNEYTLAPSKRELSAAAVPKAQDGYAKLVESLNLIQSAQGHKELVSVLDGIHASRPPATAQAASTYLSNAPAGQETLPALLATGLTELCRQKPVGLNAVEWLGNWLLENNPNQPRVAET